MRARFAIVLLAGCGGTEGTGLDAGSMDADFNSPACKACANTLNVETGQCTTSFNQCSGVMQQDTPYYIQCFRTDARCYEGSLDAAATCHDACGDPQQARVETCTGDCFVARGECHAGGLTRADACFDGCSGAAECLICRNTGIAEASACDDTAQACADQCVRTHRP